MMLTNRSLWMRLFAILLVFGLILGCLAGCGNDAKEEEEEDDPKQTTAEEKISREDLKNFAWNGLTLYLGSDFVESDYAADEGVFTGEDMDVSVSLRHLPDAYEGKITNSRKFAEAYVESEKDAYDSLGMHKANGIYYAVGTSGDTTHIIGCYVEGDYGWLLKVSCDDYDTHKDTMIAYATLGETEEGFDPGKGGADDATTPPADVTEPSGEATEPPADVTEPSGEATEPSTDATEPSTDATEPSEEPTVVEKMEVSFGSLSIELDTSFRKILTEETREIFANDSQTVYIQCKTMKEWGVTAYTSGEFCDQYAEAYGEGWDLVTKDCEGAIHMLYHVEDGEIVYMGFYVQGSTGWVVEIYGNDLERQREIAASGKLNGEEIKDPDVFLTIAVPYESQVWIEQMENEFAAAYPEYNIGWINIIMSEGDAVSSISRDAVNGPDVYMFPNDQLYSLVEVGAIAPLSDEYLDQVLADNSEFMMDSVTHADGSVYGFPVANNTWFMYYNKREFTEEDVKSLDTMLTKGKVCLPLTIGWNAGTFFLGCGGTVFGQKGNNAFAGIQYGEANGGYIAAKKMVELAGNPNVVCGDMNVDKLIDGEVDACFSGSWDAARLYEALGDELGVAMLPTFEADGKTYQMKALSGSKCIGVNAASIGWDGVKKELAMEFAALLASSESQLLRHELCGVIPAAVSLQNNQAIMNDPVAIAEMQTAVYAGVVQPGLPQMGSYWSPMENFGRAVANGEVTMENYKDMVDSLVAQLNDFD